MFRKIVSVVLTMAVLALSVPWAYAGAGNLAHVYAGGQGNGGPENRIKWVKLNTTDSLIVSNVGSATGPGAGNADTTTSFPVYPVQKLAPGPLTATDSTSIAYFEIHASGADGDSALATIQYSVDRVEWITLQSYTVLDTVARLPVYGWRNRVLAMDTSPWVRMIWQNNEQSSIGVRSTWIKPVRFGGQ